MINAKYRYSYELNSHLRLIEIFESAVGKNGLCGLVEAVYSRDWHENLRLVCLDMGSLVRVWKEAVVSTSDNDVTSEREKIEVLDELVSNSFLLLQQP